MEAKVIYYYQKVGNKARNEENFEREFMNN